MFRCVADDRLDSKTDSSLEGEDHTNVTVGVTAPSSTSSKASEQTFRVQVMIELIRMHIVANNSKLKEEQRASSSAKIGVDANSKVPERKQSWKSGVASDSDESASDVNGSEDSSDGEGSNSEGSRDSLDDLFDDLPEFIQKGLSLCLL